MDNSIKVDITTSPKVLSLTHTFKGVINKIIEIWKSSTETTNVGDLWKMLYDTEYVISILKLGSQKAIGDIFQEINSTLNNGGYATNPTNINNKTTFGFMGDRPSGIRVIKLLKNASNVEKNLPNSILPNAYGGYIGQKSTLVYSTNYDKKYKKPLINEPKKIEEEDNIIKGKRKRPDQPNKSNKKPRVEPEVPLRK